MIVTRSDLKLEGAGFTSTCLSKTKSTEIHPFRGRHVAIISAHYDDEILGAGGQLATMARVSLIHLTDSAPSDRTARAHGFPDRRSYGQARQFELDRAMASTLAGTDVQWDRHSLDLPDGLASFFMAEAGRDLARLLGALQPEIVVTQPYEGGHPDHDTAAVVTRSALRLSGLACPLWEMTGYHRSADGVVAGEFLPHPEATVVSVPLDDAARASKSAALACFVSQRGVLARFAVADERFRPAPAYDFRQAPHPGRLLYEGRLRAMRSWLWRALAAKELQGRLLPPVAGQMLRALSRVWLAR